MCVSRSTERLASTVDASSAAADGPTFADPQPDVEMTSWRTIFRSCLTFPGQGCRAMHATTRAGIDHVSAFAFCWSQIFDLGNVALASRYLSRRLRNGGTKYNCTRER